MPQPGASRSPIDDDEPEALLIDLDAEFEEDDDLEEWGDELAPTPSGSVELRPERSDMGTRLDKFVAELSSQLREKRVEIALDDAARAWLAREGYDEKFGARPMARVLQVQVKDRLADALLFGELARGGTAHVGADELGDLIFAVVNIGRHAEADPEMALRGTNAKFRRRFAHIEAELQAAGETLEAATLERMEELWQAAKAIERQLP